MPFFLDKNSTVVRDFAKYKTQSYRWCVVAMLLFPGAKGFETPRKPNCRTQGLRIRCLRRRDKIAREELCCELIIEEMRKILQMMNTDAQKK